jgi:K+-sensing histidine kinase KdpD
VTAGDLPHRGALPRRGRGLTPQRRGLGLLLAALTLPALTGALLTGRGDLALGSVLLLYLLAVVVISVIGGLAGGVLAAVGSFLLANFFLTPPYHTFAVEDRDSIIALLVFLLVAVTVSVLVDVAARRQEAAARSEADAKLLGRVAAEPLVGRSAEDVLAEVATTFGLTSVALVEHDTGAPGRNGLDAVLARVGPPFDGRGTLSVDAGGHRRLVGAGRELFAEDRRLLGSLAHAASRALDARALAGEASRARELAEVDRLRAALLAAVGHDLRTPLAGITAAVTTLRQPDVPLDDADRDELLATIERSADRLADLIANLLDLSRLQAGALRLEAQPVPVDEVVARALLDRHLHEVVNAVADDLPLVLADPGLLERVVANLADNAYRHAPSHTQVEVRAHATHDIVQVSVVDHGPGVDEADWDSIFVPFQRLDDRSTDAGVGLGLAIARGFIEAMGGTLRPEHSLGGGLTMTITLPRADPAPTEDTPR